MQETKSHRMLRVAYIAMRFPLASETFATNDVRALTDLGQEVTVLPLRSVDQTAAQKLLAERGIATNQVIPTASLVISGWRELLHNPIAWLAMIVWLVKLNIRNPRALIETVWLYPAGVGAAVHCREHGVDVAHLRWGHHPAIAGLILKRWKVPVQVSLSLSAYDLEIDLPVTEALVPLADVVRTQAEINVRAIAERYGIPAKQVQVIYNGVPDSVFSPKDQEVGADRVALSADRDPHLVVTAARLIPSKRVSNVIRAFAAVRRQSGTGNLVILGDGPERIQLGELAEQLEVASFVEFRGMVPYDEVIETMRQAGIMLMLSAKTSERLPNVVKEAMAVGCAVIATASPGIEELIPGPEFGIIVATDDVSGAADALSRLMAAPTLVRDMGAAARRHMEENFRVSVCARMYLDMWASTYERDDSVNGVFRQ